MPTSAGMMLPPSRAIPKTIPNVLPCTDDDIFENTTPIVVGNIGPNENPISRTAVITSGLDLLIISKPVAKADISPSTSTIDKPS